MKNEPNITTDPFTPDPFGPKKTAQGGQSALLEPSMMPLDMLLALRQKVEAALPARSLRDLNMAQELVLQMQALQCLQQRTLEDPEVPANQAAQCANALSSSLAGLSKMQSEVYTSERLKRVEAILIQCLNTLPMETQTAFLAEYEAQLGA